MVITVDRGVDGANFLDFDNHRFYVMPSRAELRNKLKTFC